ncbi:hypothetical protein BGZ58_002366 [Dissophora ornata]|nr:hypothetical protein BGZ58_002366 [Dissophora ornata]
MSPNQCHQYIPRFVLKNFTEERLLKEGLHVQKPRPIKTYRVLERRIVLENINTAYGTQSMYRDIPEDEWKRFETQLGRVDSSVAMFVRQILSESQELMLTRRSLEDLKKFLIITMFKNECQRKDYAEEGYDMLSRASIQRHMQFSGINVVRRVWFENLKWILQTSADDIHNEFKKSGAIESPGEALATHEGPVHVMELMDIASTMTMTMCIWEAQEGSEFILASDSFGCHESFMGVIFRHIYVVSPKFAVVLMKNKYDMSLRGMFTRKSWFENFDIDPDVVYSKRDAKGPEDYSPGDMFKFQRIVIPRNAVWLVNCMHLNGGETSISYRSNPSMYRSLVYYDKLKFTLFRNGYNYSVLKRKLVAEMNRTHRS